MGSWVIDAKTAHKCSVLLNLRFDCDYPTSLPIGSHYPQKYLMPQIGTCRTPAHCIEYAHIVMWEEQRKGEGFDADNEEHMQWMFAKSKERAETYGIQVGMADENSLLHDKALCFNATHINMENACFLYLRFRIFIYACMLYLGSHITAYARSGQEHYSSNSIHKCHNCGCLLLGGSQSGLWMQHYNGQLYDVCYSAGDSC